MDFMLYCIIRTTGMPSKNDGCVNVQFVMQDGAARRPSNERKRRPWAM
jgi:hypothetical protein